MMSAQRPVCCSSPSAVCYWCTAVLVAWGVLSLIGIYWHPLHASSAATILFAAAIGCFANWGKNRTLHCGITGPLFLLTAVAFLLANIEVIQIRLTFVWPILIVGAGISFLLEWRYAKRCAQQKCRTPPSRAPARGCHQLPPRAK